MSNRDADQQRFRNEGIYNQPLFSVNQSANLNPISDRNYGPSRREHNYHNASRPYHSRSGPTAPSREHRILIDIPGSSNVVANILGPRGKHQQKMKAESDAVVTMIGRGVRGAPFQDEPMHILMKSKTPGGSLSRRQIAVVNAIYNEIARHIQEYGSSDNISDDVVPVPIHSGLPESMVEFLWSIHQLVLTVSKQQ